MSFLLRALERLLPGAFGQRVVALLRHEGTAGTAAKGSIAAFFVAAVGVFVSFVVQFTLTRALGATEYGTYTVVLVSMNVVLLFTKAELDIVTTRFVGAYAATADWPRLHGLLRYVPRRVLLRTVIAGAIGGVVMLWMRGTSLDHFVPAGLMAIALFILTAQIMVRGAALQGFKQVLAAQVPMVVVRPALFVAAVWVLMTVGVRMAPSSAIAFNAIATAIALVILERHLRRITPPVAASATPINDLRKWLRVGYGLVFISAAQLTLSQSSDILLVAALRDRTQAAHYSIASQLAMLVAFASTAVMFIVAPLISELYAKQQMATLRRFTRATTTVCTTFALTLFIGIAAFGRPLLGLFGASFTEAYPALLVLAVSQCVSATIGALSGWIMTMTGHERPAAWMIGGSALLNIALAFPFTVAYGPVGTATATLIATLVRSFMLSIYLRRKLGVLVLPGSLANFRA